MVGQGVEARLPRRKPQRALTEWCNEVPQQGALCAASLLRALLTRRSSPLRSPTTQVLLGTALGGICYRGGITQVNGLACC